MHQGIELAVVVAFGLVGCGGELVKPDAGAVDAGSDIVTPKDASDDASDGGLCFPACPPSLPHQGDPCVGYQECEYGDAAATEQNASAQCTCGWWTVYPAPPSYATSCPGYGDGGACIDLGRRCDYQQGACKCMASGDAGLAWICQAQLPSCPWPRPRVGEACAPTDQCIALFESNGSFNCEYTCCTKAECCGGTWGFGCVSTLPGPC